MSRITRNKPQQAATSRHALQSAEMDRNEPQIAAIGRNNRLAGQIHPLKFDAIINGCRQKLYRYIFKRQIGPYFVGTQKKGNSCSCIIYALFSLQPFIHM